MFKTQVEPRSAGEWFHCQCPSILQFPPLFSHVILNSLLHFQFPPLLPMFHHPSFPVPTTLFPCYTPFFLSSSHHFTLCSWSALLSQFPPHWSHIIFPSSLPVPTTLFPCCTSFHPSSHFPPCFPVFQCPSVQKFPPLCSHVMFPSSF